MGRYKFAYHGDKIFTSLKRIRPYIKIPCQDLIIGTNWISNYILPNSSVFLLQGVGRHAIATTASQKILCLVVSPEFYRSLPNQICRVWNLTRPNRVIHIRGQIHLYSMSTTHPSYISFSHSICPFDSYIQIQYFT